MPAGMGLTFTIEGTDRIERILERASRRMSPEGMVVLNGLVADGIRENFKRNWPMGVTRRLPQTNLRWPEGSTLELTGRLRDSLAEQTENSVRVVTPYELRYGTKLFYGRFINDGTTKMAPRPFLKLSVKLRAEIIEVIKTYVGFSPDLRFTSGFRGM